MAYDLEFEKPLAELEKKIVALQRKGDRLKYDEQVQLQEMERELRLHTEEIYRNLTAWQTVQVARHKDRPYSADYIGLMCDDFFELHGDRCFADDHAIMAGPATFDGNTVMVIGHQKGRDVKEKQLRNLGMPHPEGYRKAYRLMQQAEKFRLPIICFIDTSGASPGLEDEERGQSEAIAANLYLMSRLPVPIIAVVIGEGGSGGALAIGIADRLLMLEYSIYTVASPEAAASILWRDTAFAPQAAEAMRISARELKAAHLIDELIPEPLGGAHHNYRLTADTLKAALLRHLAELKQLPLDELLEKRYQKFRTIGKFGRAAELTPDHLINY
jgi:acetyl-CoA carboxylase carboxyl transferase subunit alpha